MADSWPVTIPETIAKLISTPVSSFLKFKVSSLDLRVKAQNREYEMATGSWSQFSFFRGFESTNSSVLQKFKQRRSNYLCQTEAFNKMKFPTSGCHNLDHISRHRAQSYIRETQENNPQLCSQSLSSSRSQATRLIQSPQFSHSFICSTEMTFNWWEDKTTQFLCCVIPPYLVFQTNHLFSEVIIHYLYKILLSKRGVLATY